MLSYIGTKLKTVFDRVRWTSFKLRKVRFLVLMNRAGKKRHCLFEIFSNKIDHLMYEISFFMPFHSL